MASKFTNIALIVLVFVSTSLAQWQDLEWDIRYEATLMPNITGSLKASLGNSQDFFSSYTGFVTSSISDGIYTISTAGTDDLAVWEEYLDNFSPEIRPSSLIGYTIEIRAKVDYVDGFNSGSPCKLYVEESTLVDGMQQNRYWCLDLTMDSGTGRYYVSLDSYRDNPWFEVSPGWHTYRITADNTVGASLYIDGSETSAQSTQGYRNDVHSNKIGFGDFAGTLDGSWEIDYIRVFSGGAKVSPQQPPQPTTCQQAKLQAPNALAGDLNGDCVVDMSDLLELVSNWLLQPGWNYHGGKLPSDPNAIQIAGSPPGSFTLNGAGMTLSQIDGNVYRMSTINSNDVGYWAYGLANLPVELQPSTLNDSNYSLLFRAKINSTDEFGAASNLMLFMDEVDTTRFWDVGFLKDPNTGNVYTRLEGSYATSLIPIDSNWHTYKVQAERDGAQLFIDQSRRPTAFVPFNTNISKKQIGFGDLTGPADGDWSIDYISLDSIINKTTLNYNGSKLPSDTHAIQIADNSSKSFTLNGSGMTLSQTDGDFYRMSTINSNNGAWWSLNFTDLPSDLRPSTITKSGYTVEFRAKINSCDEFGAAANLMLLMDESGASRYWELGFLKDSNGNVYARLWGSQTAGLILVPNPSYYHTYQIRAESDSVKLYIDSNSLPAATVSYNTNPPQNDKIAFGDFAGTADGDWSIDYLILYDNPTVFTQTQTSIADFHTDIHEDGCINLKDLAILSDDWGNKLDYQAGQYWCRQTLHKLPMTFRNDGYSQFYVLTPPTDRATLEAELIDPLENTNFTALAWGVNAGEKMTCQTAAGELFGDGLPVDFNWLRAGDYTCYQNIHNLINTGNDPAVVAVERCAQIGIESILRVDLNKPYPIEPAPLGSYYYDIMTSDFNKNNPGYRISGKLNLDWAYTAVRDCKKQIISELAARIPDGVMLDFCQNPPFFTDPNASTMTQWIREIRTILNTYGNANEKHIKLIVRLDYEKYWDYCLDWKTWMDEGLIDVIIPSLYDHETAFDVDISEFVNYRDSIIGSSCKVYGFIWHALGFANTDPQPDGVPQGIDKEKTPEAYYAQSLLLHRQGADGLWLGFSSNQFIEYPFLNDLADPNLVLYADKHYMVNYRPYYLPIKMYPAEDNGFYRSAVSVPIRIADDVAAAYSAGYIVDANIVFSCRTLADNERIYIYINGNGPAIASEANFAGDGSDNPWEVGKHLIAIDSKWLICGENTITFEFCAKNLGTPVTEMEIQWADIMLNFTNH